MVRQVGTLYSLLAERASEDAHTVFLIDLSGETTRGAFIDRVDRLAGGLQQVGIGPRDRVTVQARNRREQLETLFALNRLGAVYAPLHPDLRGESLRHAVSMLDPAMCMVDAHAWEGITALALDVRQIVLDGPAPPGPHVAYPDLLTAGAPAGAVVQAQAPAMILMTSGTTGRSKGVVLSNRFVRSVAEVNRRCRRLGPEDRLHTCYSFCHTNPHCFTLAPALLAGGSMAWTERFSTSGFWHQVQTLGATQFSLFTSPMRMLLEQEPSDLDAKHGASICLAIGTPRGHGAEFEERFGVRLVEAYGMTECGAVSFQWDEARRLESAGKPVDEWDVRIMDPDGRLLDTGETGEIVGRPQAPGMLMDGYFRDPAATLRTYDDLWFHTGDRGYFDEDGFLWFAGRVKDVIRYRGENISAVDVEEAARATGLVRDAAAVGIESGLGEDELLLVAEADVGAEDPEALYESLAANLPRFSLPRHIRYVSTLPRTASGRVMKGQLRDEGAPAGTWEPRPKATTRE